MKFGIIGCGSIARNSFAPSLMNSAKTDLVAVCRRDLAGAQAFAADFGGCRAYDSAQDLIADPDIEAVIVSTPPDTHRDYTLAAAAAGKHVLCEKPMARNRGECREMIEACQTAGVRLAVAYRRRVFPQVVEAKRLIAAGAIGKPVCVRTHYSGWGDLSSGAWQMEPGIGGALMEMAVHRLEVLLNLADAEAVAVSAMIDTVHHDWQVDDTDAILLRFDDGRIGVHSTIMTSKPRRDFAQVDGADGRILIQSLEFGGDHIELETPGGVERIEVTPLAAPHFDQPMIEDLVDAADQGREPICDGFMGFRVQAVCDAARAASASGAQVDVEVF
ncbi:MAG: Gfo/Idh/MocA family oxidoreductase [Gemmatimonadetes bacterium]|nr:Gfo/Idh/MocA family oxidoreductase [Gemmatimonadota bacterium]MBT6149532.1 Gfo/Idh/MocA family oxidoreductase [Gemmatimonadota bacterium]MBT7863599.1 Gfo/Idh/MocA family oxidoreductase [Gemmatimonadota bacterium]